MNKLAIGTLGSILGFIFAQLLSIYQFQKGIEISQKVEKIHLARELVKEFYAEDAIIFRELRTAVESCSQLYLGYKKGGKFNNDEINRYLGFFDDIGFYYRQGVLDLDIIDQQFGAYIIEANEYAELRRYINELQENAKQQSAFNNFRFLAEALEKLPGRKQLTEKSRQPCLL